jgi:hypothetical protein
VAFFCGCFVEEPSVLQQQHAPALPPHHHHHHCLHHSTNHTSPFFHPDTYPSSRSYGAEQGKGELREAVCKRLYEKVGRKPSEIFVSDGSKCDIGRLQLMFGADMTVALQVGGGVRGPVKGARALKRWLGVRRGR